MSGLEPTFMLTSTARIEQLTADTDWDGLRSLSATWAHLACEAIVAGIHWVAFDWATLALAADKAATGLAFPERTVIDRVTESSIAAMHTELEAP